MEILQLLHSITECLENLSTSLSWKKSVWRMFRSMPNFLQKLFNNSLESALNPAFFRMLCLSRKIPSFSKYSTKYFKISSSVWIQYSRPLASCFIFKKSIGISRKQNAVWTLYHMWLFRSSGTLPHSRHTEWLCFSVCHLL